MERTLNLHMMGKGLTWASLSNWREGQFWNTAASLRMDVSKGVKEPPREGPLVFDIGDKQIGNKVNTGKELCDCTVLKQLN